MNNNNLMKIIINIVWFSTFANSTNWSCLMFFTKKEITHKTHGYTHIEI